MKLQPHRDPWLPDAPVVRSLILLNTLVWLAGLVGDVFGHPAWSTEGLRLQFGLFPELVFAESMLWTPFTYMFLHGNTTHLVVNMLGLYLLGPDLERAFRRGPFLLLYLFSGLLGGIGYVVVSYVLLGQLFPCVGASGAISGLLGAIVALYPRRVYVMLPLMIPLRASTLAVLMLSTHLFFLFTPFGGQVAYDVHLFGGLSGYAVAKVLAARHRRVWKARVPGLDWQRDVGELELLVLRAVRGDDPLSDSEWQRLRLLEQALRYEDVLTLAEAGADAAAAS